MMKDNDPIAIFTTWFNEAKTLPLEDPNAMVLSTVNKEGYPSSRVVLLKHYDEKGFCFYTNLTSRKGQELNETGRVALNLYWEALHKQIRIEGEVELLSDKEADDYFASRSRGSQLGAWASKQSTPMAQSTDLADRLHEITQTYEGQVIPRPPFWSGFRVIPRRIEFWQEGEYRLHTRLSYYKSDDGSNWESVRLYP